MSQKIRLLAAVIFVCLVDTIAALPTASPSINCSISNVSRFVHILSGNCTQIDFHTVPDQREVLEISAQFCSIPQLENAIFIRFTKLHDLEIVDSQLTTLQDYALNGLQALQSLSLARNSLTIVKSWSNENMLALLSLDLRRNSIRELTAASFHRYPNLQKLNLAANLIEHIDDSIFQWLPQLKLLNLGRNLLTTVDEISFHGLSKLTHLSLHFNRIAALKGGQQQVIFQANTHLGSLRLDGNRLNQVDFSIIARLAHLNLSHNSIDSLTRLQFPKHSELRSFDVSHNHLTQIGVDTFDGLEMLEILNTSHNAIITIAPKSFHTLSSLVHLDMSSNNLTQLPADLFTNTVHMRRINLSRNALTELDAMQFAKMNHLEQIDLCWNQLHSDNFIESIGECDTSNCSNSQGAHISLDLSYNRFSVLNLSVFYDFERVDLAGNLWNCRWLINEIFQAPPTVHFGQNYSVASRRMSLGILQVPGIDCYEDTTKRSIILLGAAGNDEAKESSSTSTFVWPKIRLDRLDSRSVIIWMLIAIIIAFSSLRIARVLIDRADKVRAMKHLNSEQEQKNLMENNNQSKPNEEVSMTELNLTEDSDTPEEDGREEEESDVVPKK